MKTRLIVTVLSLVLVASCAAFDKGQDQPYAGFEPDVTPPPITIVDTKFEGDYSGTMMLKENNCEALEDEAGVEVPLAINVIQSDKVVSVEFEDGEVINGNLDDNNEAALVKKEDGVSKVYYLDFVDDGTVSGRCEYIESAADSDQLGQYCAIYVITLSKTEAAAE